MNPGRAALAAGGRGAPAPEVRTTLSPVLLLPIPLTVLLLVAAAAGRAAHAQADLDAAVRLVHRSGCARGLADLSSLSAGGGLEAQRAAYLAGWCLTRQERHAEAAAAFQTAAAHPTLRPHALVATAEALVKAGRAGEAAAVLRDEGAALIKRDAAGTAGHGTPPVGGTLRARALDALGRAELALGRPGPAVAALKAAAESGPGGPGLWMRLAEAALAASQRPVARRALAYAAWAFPGDPLERPAREALARLLGRPVKPADIPAEIRLERGRRLQQNGEWEHAVTELRAVTAAAPASPMAGEAWYRLGELSLAADLRASHAAFRRAAALGWNVPQAHYWAAVTARRLGRVAEAQEARAALMRVAPSSRWAARAWLEAGLRAEDGGRTVEAAAHYRRAAVAAPESHEAAEARWRLGWMSLGAGRWREAEARFREAAQAAPSRGEAARAWYWAARASESRGDPAAGLALLRMVAEQYPLAFYGQRARQRLGMPAPVLPSAPAHAAPRDAPGPAHEELARLGLDAEAADAADDLVADLPADRREAGLVRFLAEVHNRLGAFHRSVAYAEEALRAGLRDEGTWRLAYPKAFWTEVRAAAQAAGVDPLLLLALVREESRYDPAVISPARAVGLAQLLVPTARAITSTRSLTVRDLKDPALNLRLGARYLRLQVNRFNGDLRLALAAYNAGPTAARRWVGLDADPDAIIEKIGYAETRAYVRRVLGSYGIYRLLW